MRAEELRIGNWVFDDDGIHAQVIGFNPFDHSVRCDEDEGCEILIDVYAPDGQERKGYFCDSNYVNPISLTEEMLVKCGFSMKWGTDPQEPNALKVFTHAKVHLRLLIDERDTRYTTMLGESYRLSPVSYLHQLQNLYFALTGEELEIKF